MKKINVGEWQARLRGTVSRAAIAIGAFGLAMAADVERAGAMQDGVVFKNTYVVECIAPDGTVKWREEVPNIVVNAGLNDVLDKYFKGSTYTAAFYVGLVDNAGFSAYAAGDTMSSHAGWTEFTSYSGTDRPTLTLGSVASQSVNNSASKAAFSISSSGTVRGAFITTGATKGGTSGTLFGAASFASTRSVDNGDTLNVTTTLTAASA
jgi:hypothetical protein